MYRERLLVWTQVTVAGLEERHDSNEDTSLPGYCPSTCLSVATRLQYLDIYQVIAAATQPHISTSMYVKFMRCMLEERELTNIAQVTACHRETIGQFK